VWGIFLEATPLFYEGRIPPRVSLTFFYEKGEGCIEGRGRNLSWNILSPRPYLYVRTGTDAIGVRRQRLEVFVEL
jgi:hypothetical protein